MKTLKTIGYILFFTGLFLGTLGQIIWSIIFWDNLELFMKHWLIAMLGLIMAVLGSPAPIKDLGNYILYGK